MSSTKRTIRAIDALPRIVVREAVTRSALEVVIVTRYRRKAGYRFQCTLLWRRKPTSFVFITGDASRLRAVARALVKATRVVKRRPSRVSK